MQRMLITGSSGYLGRVLLAHLATLPDAPHTIGLDQSPPQTNAPNEFHSLDIRSPALAELIRKIRPDIVVHLAFVLSPIRSASEMESINVGGTKQLFAALKDHLPRQLMVASSATAFGAWPDQSAPLDDNAPVRGRSDFSYSLHKVTVENLTKRFAGQNPACQVSWVRPTTIVGPSAENFITRFLVGMPFLAKLGPVDNSYQFVHENDVARAMMHIIRHEGVGAFNIAPSDTITMAEIAKMARKPYYRMPFMLAWGMSSLAWKLRIKMVEAPPGFLWLARFPWTVNPRRLKEELNFEFEYSSRQALDRLFRHVRGIRSGLKVYDYVKANEADQARSPKQSVNGT
jgi:UDP-glucose 4-epimerase